jgi:predicted tellurium resistance membrane protein TerC
MHHAFEFWLSLSIIVLTLILFLVEHFATRILSMKSGLVLTVDMVGVSIIANQTAKTE